MAITALGGILTATGTATAAARPADSGARFTQAIARLLEQSEQSDAEANRKLGAMLDGSGDVHDAMVALQQSELSLQLTVQVRNKLMNAYHEIMRMPV